MGPGAAHRIYYEVTHTKPGPKAITRADVEAYIGGVKLGMGESQTWKNIFRANEADFF